VPVISLLTALVPALAIPTASQATTVTIDFEGFPDSTILTNQYPRLTFTNAIILTAGISLNEFEFPPHSGTNVVADDNGPMTIDFSPVVTSVSGFFTYSTSLTLSAFDAASSLLTTAQSAFSDNLALSGDPGSSPNELISLSSASGIASVEILGDPGGFSFALDDFTYVTGGSPPSSAPEPSALLLLTSMCTLLYLWRRKRRLNLSGTERNRFSTGSFSAAILCVLVWAGPAFAQSPTASPAAVTVGTSTTIFVTISLPDPTIIPQSVVVQELLPSGAVVLGPLVDDGTDGDLVAGDHVYSGEVTVNPSALGTVTLRVSWGKRGALLRQASSPTTLDVLPSGIPTSPSPPDLTQTDIDPVSGAKIISNEVLACFSSSATIAQVQSVVALVSGQLIGRFSDVGQCYQIQLPTSSASAVDSAIVILSAQPLVVSAEADVIIPASGSTCTGLPTCSPMYGEVAFKNVGLPLAQTVSTGALQTVAVLDSGIDTSNLALAAHVLPVVLDLTGANSVKDDTHGTAVSTIVAATAPDAKILPVRVLSKDVTTGKDVTTPSILANGIFNAVDLGIRIINMSLAGRVQSPLVTLNIITAETKDALLVASAGNDGDMTVNYPAGDLGVISVGNVDDTDLRWAGAPEPSSHGNSWVKIAAPGVKVPAFGLNDAVVVGTGTSFSAPFVAGTAALVRSRFAPTLTATQIGSQLRISATPIAADSAGNANQDLGSGRLDAYAALGAMVLTHTGFTSSVDFTVTGTWGDSAAFTLGKTGVSCELKPVPPSTSVCSADFPLTLSKLTPGTYQLTFANTDLNSDVSLNVALAVPGLSFKSVVPGNGSGTINNSDNQRASVFLIGKAINANLSFVKFNVVKQ
jgi:subtilisin family serine protease